MTEAKKQDTVLKILSLWESNKQDSDKGRENWLKYKLILEEMKKYGLSQRTIVRYLNALVNEGKLEKEERGYKRTFYRPTQDFWEDIKHENQRFLKATKALEPIAAFVMEHLKATTNENKAAEDEGDKNWKKIVAAGGEGEAFEEVMDAFFEEKKLTKQEETELLSLVRSLFNDALLNNLTDRAVFSYIESTSDLPDTVQNGVWETVKAYLALWKYIYKHPGAVVELERMKAQIKGLTITGQDRDEQEQA